MSHVTAKPPTELFLVQLGPERFKTFTDRHQLKEFLRATPTAGVVSRSELKFEKADIQKSDVPALYVYRLSVFERMPYPAIPDDSRTAIYEVVLPHGGETMREYLLHIFNKHVFGYEYGRPKDGLRFDSCQPLRRTKTEVFGPRYAYRLVKDFPETPQKKSASENPET